MNNKKILISFLLVVLMALSLSAVSAIDDADGDVIAVDDDVAVSVDDSEVLSGSYSPESNTSDAVQTAVSSATNTGDIVDLSNYDKYDFGSKIVTVDKSNIIIKGNGATTIYGYGNVSDRNNGGIFHITANNVTISGIQFVNTCPTNNMTYGGKTMGVAIRADRVDTLTIKECNFTNYDQAIRVQASSNALVENNEFHGGYTTLIENNPTKNVEEGSKTLSVGGSRNVIIRNNLFEGPMLDGLSMFGGSGGNNLISNNTFIGNSYAIYFGGASTKGSVLKGNKFINCGQFVKDGQNLTGLPVISIQKSSDGIAIENNTFEAVENSVLIAGEAGNEAHGDATRMGDINITANKVTAFNGAKMDNVTFFYILVRDGSSFEMDSALNVTGNTLADDVKGISVWFDGHEIYTADESVISGTLYPSTLYATSIEATDLVMTEGESGTLKITLKDSNNDTLRGKSLVVIFEGKVIDAVTDAKGVATVTIAGVDAGVKYATISYSGEGSIYKSAIATAKVTVNAKPAPATPATPTTPAAAKTVLTVKKATLKVKKAKKIKVTLKSGSKAVSGKVITIKVNKKTFKAKTNKKGVATISVKVTKKGKFNAVVSFKGDSTYKAVTKTVKFTVK